MRSLNVTKYFICDGNSQTIYEKLDKDKFIPFFNDDLKLMSKNQSDILFKDYPGIKIVYLTKFQVDMILYGKITVNQLFKEKFDN